MEGHKYAKAIGEIYKGILPLLRPKSHAVINLTDLWWENKRIPIHIYVIESMQDAGYELRNIIIWDKRGRFRMLAYGGEVTVKESDSSSK